MEPFELSQSQCWFDMGWCVRASSLDWPSPHPAEISLDGVIYSSSEICMEAHHVMGRGWHYWSEESQTALSVFA